MLRCVFDVEHDRNLGIKAATAERREVWFGIEYEPVSSVSYGAIDEKERFDAAVSVGPGVAQFGPGLVRVLHLERNRDATGGRSARSVEDVG